MHDVEHEKTYIPGNGNGNKLNRRLEMLERLLRASDGDGTCARTNSLRQALRRNKSDMADDTAKSLDVLRQVFQADLTEEIKQVIDRYVRASFTPAFENLRRNGNEVTEADIAKLCVDILNGAKAAFEPTTAAVPMTTMAQEMPTVTDDECCGTEAKCRRRRCVPAFTALLKPLSHHPQPLQQQQQQNVEPLVKLYDSDGNESDGASLASFNSSVLNISTGLSTAAASDCRQQQQQQLKRRGRPKKADMMDTGRSGTPVMNGQQPISAAEAMKWNPGRFTSESRFVIASKVNRLLGFSSRGGGHLFSVYSRAFRYVADDEDRVWLFQRGLTKWAANGGGKLFVMSLEDAVEIAELEGIDVNVRAELQRYAFTGPERMLIKMRSQMIGPHFQLRARVLPTASAGAGASGASMLDIGGGAAGRQQQQHTVAMLHEATTAQPGGFVPAFHL